MGQDLYNLTCPCCGAVLEVDAATQTILTHQAPKPESVPEDLQEAVKRLKAEQGTRDQRFREQVDLERQHGLTLENRFEGLLKKARTEGPQKPGLRDIDLD